MKHRKRTEERERGRAAVGVIFARLDEIEAKELEYRRLGETEGEEAARTAFPKPSAGEIADEVRALIVICDRRADNFLAAVELWSNHRGKALGPEDEDERATRAIYLSMLTNVGNLFGRIPSSAPAFDPDLAAEGKRRGWGR